MTLDKSKRYVVSESFGKLQNSNGGILQMYGYEILAQKNDILNKITLDLRTKAVINNPEYDDLGYMKYMILMSEICNELLTLSTMNRFTDLLDNGYIPLLTPPTMYEEDHVAGVKYLITTSDLDLLSIPAISIYGLRLGTSVDIWGKRLDIEKKLGIPPKQQTTVNIIERLAR